MQFRCSAVSICHDHMTSLRQLHRFAHFLEFSLSALLEIVTFVICALQNLAASNGSAGNFSHTVKQYYECLRLQMQLQTLNSLHNFSRVFEIMSCSLITTHFRSRSFVVARRPLIIFSEDDKQNIVDTGFIIVCIVFV